MIRRIVLALAVVAAGCGAAFALSDSSIPIKIPTYWGTSAPGANNACPIPIPSQIGSNPGRASWTDGFPPLTFSPIASGGIPPSGADFNGVLCQLSQWTRWENAGAPVFYDATFSSLVGGYPNGAVLAQAANPTCEWVSTVDNNASNPDAAGANWISSCPGGGTGGTSTGSANAQVVTTTPFTLQVLSRVCFIAGYANTSALQINVNSAGLVNVFQRTEGGMIALVGGEVQIGMVVCVEWDGTQWELDTFATNASLVNEGQTVSGGAGINSLNLGTITTGTTTINCTARPYQYLTNGGTFTLAAPTVDSGCGIQITNNSNAGTITFSGFTVNSNYTGATMDTTNGHKFMVSIQRINGSSIYTVIPQQLP